MSSEAVRTGSEPHDSSLQSMFRAAVALVVLIGTYGFVFWFPGTLLGLHEVPWLAPGVSLLCALVAARFVWSRTGSVPGALVVSVCHGAIVLGAIGFAVGFFGPMVLSPDSNQGPLLGIFITGPAGVAVGAVHGFLRWRNRRYRLPDPV